MQDKTAAFVLRVSDLTISYGNFRAVRDVSFEVKPGEIFGLLGPNGAGKTSTLSAIEGLLKPDSGEIPLRVLISANSHFRQKPIWAYNCNQRVSNLNLPSQRLSGSLRASMEFHLPRKSSKQFYKM